MRHRYTPKALGQLAKVLAHIESHNASAARRVGSRIQKSIKRAEQFPYSCRATSKQSVRVLPVLPYPYLLFYEIDETAQEIVILSLRHQARNPSGHMK